MWNVTNGNTTHCNITSDTWQPSTSHELTFLYVPDIVHQQHRAVWHHGKVGGVEVRQNPNIPNAHLLLRRLIQHWEEETWGEKGAHKSFPLFYIKIKDILTAFCKQDFNVSDNGLTLFLFFFVWMFLCCLVHVSPETFIWLNQWKSY